MARTVGLLVPKKGKEAKKGKAPEEDKATKGKAPEEDNSPEE